MNLSGFTLKEGQRFQLCHYGAPKFIAEIISVFEGRYAALKIVHIQDWPQCNLGYVYSREDLARDDYTYLLGQDRPVS